MTLGLDESFQLLTSLEDRGRAARRTLETVTLAELPELPPEPETKDFYLFGVLGAKNVGKSSLVASLLGLEHEPEEGRELGAGTRRPRVFAGPELLPRVLETFARAGVEAEAADHPGLTAGLEKVAFVDLPDIESRFEDHLPQVMSVNGEIDGLVVVRTAESSFDQAFLDKLRAFRRPQMDLYLVMNKFDDWVASRGDLGEARAVCTEHLAEVLHGLDLSTEDVFMTDARPAEIREGDGYDLSRLARQLLRDKSAEELQRAKLRAWVFQLRTWSEALRREADLRAGQEVLAGVLTSCREVLEALESEGAPLLLGSGEARPALPAPAPAPGAGREPEASPPPAPGGLGKRVPASIRERFDRFVERRLVTSRQVEQAEARLVRRVFHHRVEFLPFARVLGAPLFVLGELLDGLLGRGSSGAASQLVAASDPEALEAVGGLFESINEGFELDRAALAESFRSVPEEGLLSREEGGRLLQAVFQRCLTSWEEKVCARVRPPWSAYQLAMWLPVLWFLLLRPLTKLYLARGTSTGWDLLVAGLPVVLLELTTPSALIAALVTLFLLYSVVLFREYHRAFRSVHDLDDLEGARLEWARGVTGDLYREVFGRVLPDRFRRLDQCLEDASEQLRLLDAGLEELDPEAFGDAERQLVPGGGAA